MTKDTTNDLRHLASDAPRILVVDGSRLVRKLIGDVLKRELPGVEMVGCGSLAEAGEALVAGNFDLVTTALVLPDGDGQTLARSVRESVGQRYVPVIVVSGNAQQALESRSMGEDVTDYFDKALGHGALAEFIRGYVQPQPIAGASVLYVEDSRVVALATRRMLERQQIEVVHVTTAEEAIAHLKACHDLPGAPGVDLVLSDVYLKGELSGRDLLRCVRDELDYGKRVLPVLIMTGDENPDKQSELLREGANDLVIKPVEERMLVTKALFQLRLSRMS